MHTASACELKQTEPAVKKRAVSHMNIKSVARPQLHAPTHYAGAGKGRRWTEPTGAAAGVGVTRHRLFQTDNQLMQQ